APSGKPLFKSKTVRQDDGRVRVRSTKVPPGFPLAVLKIRKTADLAIVADGRASSDVRGAIRRFQIIFGDGTRIRAKRAAHVYAQPGTYTVRLRVIDNHRNKTTVSAAITFAAAVTPTATPTVPPPAAG